MLDLSSLITVSFSSVFRTHKFAPVHNCIPQMPMEQQGINWIRFLRKYGPIPRNDNMYDEAIHQSATRARLEPIIFDHPFRHEVLECFDSASSATSVVLTGAAGDGKTHLCRQVWQTVTNKAVLDEPYVTTQVNFHGQGSVRLHIIKDLSEWIPQAGANWEQDKERVLQRFCESVYEEEPKDIFLIAANDGQLVDSWRFLSDTESVVKTRKLFEYLLVNDLRSGEGARLKFFNLSRGDSADLLERALDALISHEGWLHCYQGAAEEFDAFGPNCPIRQNYELLQTPLVRRRLKELFQLCDFNELHVPIRQILLLLSNAILGHPGVKDRLMVVRDVATLVRSGTVAKASLYNNVFGGNLLETRRDGITVFNYLNRFRIGYETSNRIDNILIFGAADEELQPHFEQLLVNDKFYGADASYYAAQRNYVEGPDEDQSSATEFLEMLVSQRRGLFFKILPEQEQDLHLWDLTVFKYAGEYLDRVVNVLRQGGSVEHPILARLVRGLNRIFIGMLVANDRELHLATSLSFSNARVSRILEDSIPVRRRGHERVELVLRGAVPSLNVVLTESLNCAMDLHLVRYEFLSRVAEGALPNSFSRECYEDMLAFKSQLLARLSDRQRLYETNNESKVLTFRLLNLDDLGNPVEDLVEVNR